MTRRTLAVVLGMVWMIGVTCGPALGIGGTAYTDAAGAGNWSTPSAWDQNSGYPGQTDPTDTATIDQGTMTVDVDVPSFSGATVDSGGKIYARRTLSNANTVTINNGGVGEFYTWYQNGHTWSWAVNMNDGSLFYANMHDDGTMAGDLAFDGTSELRHHGGQYHHADFTGDFSGPNTSTVNLTKAHSTQNYSMRLRGDNAAWLSDINVNCNIEVYHPGNDKGGGVCNALGVNTGAGEVKVNSGGRVAVIRNYQTSNLELARDLSMCGGNLYSYCHNDHRIDWTGTVTLKDDATVYAYSRDSYQYGRMYFDGQFTEDGTPRALTFYCYGNGAYHGRVYLNNSNNDFTGGLHVKSGAGENGRLIVNAAGACGDGTVYVHDGAELQIDAADGVDPDNVVYVLDSGSGLLDLNQSCTVQALNLGGTWDDLEGAVVGGTWANVGVYSDGFDGYIAWDGTHTLTVLQTFGIVPEPAGLGFIATAFLALRRRRRGSRTGTERRSAMLKRMMCALLVLALASPAWAVSYTSARDGKFDASDVDTWGAGAGVYPDDATDDATVGAHTVQVYNDVASLHANGITINSGGTLYNRVSQTGTNNVTVNNGGLMRFYSSYNNYKDAPNWTVTMNNGGTTHIDDLRYLGTGKGLGATLVVADSASATLRCSGGGGDNQPYIRGTISGPATGALTVKAVGSVQYKSRIQFGGDNSGLLCDVALDHVYYDHQHTNALGPATATPIEVKNGSVVRVRRGYQNADRQMIRDLEVYDGSISAQGHNQYPVTWPGDITLMSDTTIGIGASGTYDWGRVWLNGQISEDATPRALTINTTGSSAYRGRGTLNNSANDFSALHVKGGRLLVAAAGACGDGDVIIYDGAELETEIADAVDPDNVVYILDSGSGLLDLNHDCTVTALNVGGTWDDLEGAVVGGTWANVGVYAEGFDGYIAWDGAHTLTVLQTFGIVPEPAGLSLLGLALLGLRRRRS